MTRCVYVIVEGEAGPCKIGLATDARERLSQLRTGAARPLQLHFHASTSDAAAVEKEAHALLRDKRLRGEWFDVTPEQAVSALLQIDPTLVPLPARTAPAPVTMDRPEGAIENLDDVRAMIGLWPTKVALAKDVGTTRNNVQAWWSRNEIPPLWIHKLATVAIERGFSSLSREDLMHELFRRYYDWKAAA